MYFTIIVLFCVLQVSSTTDNYAYYSPLFPLSWFEAEAYCKTQCNSNLATIPHANQTTLIVDIFSDVESRSPIEDIWIGLHKPDTNASYEWVENTNNTSYHYNSSTWTDYCIYLSLTDSQLYDTSCDAVFMFVCNSCDGIINKYILTLKDEWTQSDALNECESLYETSLASIHSQSDYEEAINLCQIFGNNSRCWIGLRFLGEIPETESWEWLDETTFDFGTDWGEYPWNDSPTQGKPCVYIRYDVLKSEWLWDFAVCSDTGYPLCNMRSELLCTEQYVVYGNEDNINFECGGYSIGDDEYTMVILDTELSEKLETETVIEFMFSITTVDSDRNRNGGIILTHTTIECSYLYVGISPGNNVSESMVFIKFVYDSEDLIEEEKAVPSNISNSDYYLLRINGSEDNIFDVWLNNIHISYQNLESFPITVGYVGMIANNVEIIGKYLYVSGTNPKIDDLDKLEGFRSCSYIDTDTDDYVTTDYNENTYDTESDESGEEEEFNISTEGIVVISIMAVLLICCGVFGFYKFKRKKKEREETQKQTEEKTKEKIEQETNKEIEERERKYSEVQQKSNERIQKLEEELERLKELEERRSVEMDDMMQPGSPPKPATSKTSFEVEDSGTQTVTGGAEGVPGNVHNVEGHYEGYEKVTQIDSAVRLDIPQAAFVSNRNIYETNDGGNTAAGTGDDEKGVMDEMLADVLKMKSSDPNIVTQLSVINDVENKADDDTDTESDNMYDNDDNEQRKDARADDAEDAANELDTKEKEKNVDNEGLPKGIGMVVSKRNIHNGNDDSDSGNSDDIYDRNNDDKGHPQDAVTT